MSVGYRAVQWNRHKLVYDGAMLLIVGLAIASFMAVTAITNARVTVETLVIRGTALTAFMLLTLILSIGPLARLDRRFLPLLYNRRHLGVAMFLLATIHAGFSILQFHAFGDANPLVSVLTAYRADYDPFIAQSGQISRFPFEPLGLAALVILFLMAATSHDFWLANLGASWWKRLHLPVLAAFGLAALHIALGALQSERHPLYPILLIGATLWVYGLHAAAGWREARRDRGAATPLGDSMVRACASAELAEGRPVMAWLGGERIAVWRHEGRAYATANVCRHQGGPLGEGRIVDGCLTCPWHGWQYRPADGRSPPPFDEQVPTFRVRLAEGAVWVDPHPSPAATVQPGAPLAGNTVATRDDEFYVGYLAMPRGLRHFTLGAVTVLALAVPAVVAALAAGQRPLPTGTFEFGVRRGFEGVLYEHPIPLLRVHGADGGASTMLLVGAGKAGLPEFAHGADGHRVRFAGSLIYREQMTMVEMNDPASFEVLDGGVSTPRRGIEVVGPITVVGELVDTKCYLGVMKPATGKVHRACAIRCLSGGVPPGVLVRTAGDDGVVFMLAGRDGSALDYDVQWAALTVTAAGTLELHDATPVIRIDRIARLDVDAPAASAAQRP